MTARYRCPWCGTAFPTRDRALNHMFGFHATLIRERLAMTRDPRPHKDPIAPPRRLKDHLQSNLGVPGEGDSS